MNRERAQDFDQELLNLYDDYAHGRLSRRDFAHRAAAFAVGGITAEALLERLSPNYALRSRSSPTTRGSRPRPSLMSRPRAAARCVGSSHARRPKTRSSRRSSSSTRIAG